MIDDTYLDWDWTPINRSRNYIKTHCVEKIEDLDWEGLERAFRLDCAEDIGGLTELEISMARSVLAADHERLTDLLEAVFTTPWSHAASYALRVMWLKLDLEFKEEERHLMKVRLKLDDAAIATERSGLREHANEFSFVSEQANTDATVYGKTIIDLQRDIIDPVKERTGVDLLKRYPVKTPFSDINQSFERKVIYELGKGNDPFYKPVSYLRWHHAFKKGAKPRIPADPDTGRVVGSHLFGAPDEVKIWMYQRDRLPILIDRLSHAVESGIL